MRLALALTVALPLASCSEKKAGDKAPPSVAIETSLGRIEVELDPRAAPLTVENFLAYVDDGHYDGTAFHRVIPGFMVQGGGFAAEEGMLIQKVTRKPIRNEASSSGLSNTRGTIAMARTQAADSATAQFFINLTDNSTKLDPGGFAPAGYAVFGKVTSGMDVVDQIAAVETKVRTLVSLAEGSGQVASQAKDVPAEDVLIQAVRRVKR